MSLSIKEMRMKAGMSQQKFADHFRIPLSTIRKWEQGITTPPVYLVDLIAGALPALNDSLERIEGRNGAVYYYDSSKRQLIDKAGNTVNIKEDLNSVNKQNLRLYVSDLFDSFYEIQQRFDSDCYYDRQNDILWTE